MQKKNIDVIEWKGFTNEQIEKQKRFINKLKESKYKEDVFKLKRIVEF